MKIALVLPAFPVENEVSLPADEKLVCLLAERAELHLFCLFYPSGRRTFRSGTAIVHPSGLGQYRQMFARVLRDIRSEHRRSAFDVVHANRLYPGGLLAIMAGRWLQIPSIASIGGVELVNFADIGYGGSQTKVARVLNGFVLGNADLVTVPSQYILSQAQTVRPDQNYELAPLPINLGHDDQVPVTRTLEFDPVRPRILSAGSLYPLKDQETLIRAFGVVHDEIPGASLTIVGADPFGYRQELDEIVAELDLRCSVEFAGEVLHEKMSLYYQNADLFMYASRHESQGLVILEAASLGLPIVSTNVGIVPELAGKAGIAVPVRDPNALGTAALNVLNDPTLRQKLSDNAAKYVQESFGDEQIAEKFMDLYQQVGR